MTLEFQSTKDDPISYKCSSCGKIFSMTKEDFESLKLANCDINEPIRCDCGSFYTQIEKPVTPKVIAKKSMRDIWFKLGIPIVIILMIRFISPDHWIGIVMLFIFLGFAIYGGYIAVLSPVNSSSTNQNLHTTQSYTELKCPKCGSTNLTANNKGFGLGKAAVGGVLLGPVGLLGGLVGSKKPVFICLKCGNQFEK